MNMINKKYRLLFFGIFSFGIIFLVSETANAIDENNDELIESAMNFIKIDRIDKAIPILEEVLEKDPNNLNALKNLAIAYTDSKMCNESIKLYDKILEIKSNSPEIFYGKAVCFNDIGEPEKALLTLKQLDEKFDSDNNILSTKIAAHILLHEFEIAKKYTEKILENKPDSKSANYYMLLLSFYMKDHVLAEKYLVKIFGNEPKKIGSSCSTIGCMGATPFLFPMKHSENFEITAQIQVRNESNALIAIIDSKTINYTPHPIFEKILSNYDTEFIQNEFGTFEVTKIIQKSKPMINSYFMDRTQFFYNDYSILFAYNLAIPLEPGDYIITEWIIQKKI